MKIILLDAATVSNGDIDFSIFNALGEVVSYPLTKPCEIVERLTDADAVLINKVVLTESVLKQLPKLKYIGLFATGYNNIDLECATRP